MNPDDALENIFQRFPSEYPSANNASSLPPWDKGPEAGRQIIEDLIRFIRSFLVLSEPGLMAIALWIVHTHAIDAAYATPYLHIRSPQKQCGKTRLLELLSLLVARPWFTARTSPAALIRKISKAKPTLLLDETDAALAAEKEYVEVLRGVLNAGNLRGGKASVCVGKDHAVEDFEVFGAKALAGIGRLPDTVADRSIPIEMKRRLPSEHVRRLRRRDVEPEADALRMRVENWAVTHVDALKDARPSLPEQLSDRAQDGWEPLLAIAEVCAIGEEAAKAAVSISGIDEEPEDIGLRALADLRVVFDERERIPSREIVEMLRAIADGPYGPMRGRDFDERALARRLKPFGVRPEQLKFGEKNVRGYERAVLAELWDRYLPPYSSEKTDTTATSATFRKNPEKTGNAPGIGSGSYLEPFEKRSGVADVAPFRHECTFHIGAAGETCHRCGTSWPNHAK